jgi:hypothetical protein
MRLIDADEFKRQIAGMAIVNGYSAQKANKMCELIDKQPTDYDVDKVLKQLEDEKSHISLLDDELEVYKSAIDDAIEIVKAGGMNNNSKTSD